MLRAWDTALSNPFEHALDKRMHRWLAEADDCVQWCLRLRAAAESMVSGKGRLPTRNQIRDVHRRVSFVWKKYQPKVPGVRLHASIGACEEDVLRRAEEIAEGLLNLCGVYGWKTAAFASVDGNEAVVALVKCVALAFIPHLDAHAGEELGQRTYAVLKLTLPNKLSERHHAPDANGEDVSARDVCFAVVVLMALAWAETPAKHELMQILEAVARQAGVYVAPDVLDELALTQASLKDSVRSTPPMRRNSKRKSRGGSEARKKSRSSSKRASESFAFYQLRSKSPRGSATPSDTPNSLPPSVAPDDVEALHMPDADDDSELATPVAYGPHQRTFDTDKEVASCVSLLKLFRKQRAQREANSRRQARERERQQREGPSPAPSCADVGADAGAELSRISPSITPAAAPPPRDGDALTGWDPHSTEASAPAQPQAAPQQTSATVGRNPGKGAPGGSPRERHVPAMRPVTAPPTGHHSVERIAAPSVPKAEKSAPPAAAPSSASSAAPEPEGAGPDAPAPAAGEPDMGKTPHTVIAERRASIERSGSASKHRTPLHMRRTPPTDVPYALVRAGSSGLDDSFDSLVASRIICDPNESAAAAAAAAAARIGDCKRLPPGRRRVVLAGQRAEELTMHDTQKPSSDLSLRPVARDLPRKRPGTAPAAAAMASLFRKWDGAEATGSARPLRPVSAQPLSPAAAVPPADRDGRHEPGPKADRPGDRPPAAADRRGRSPDTGLVRGFAPASATRAALPSWCTLPKKNTKCRRKATLRHIDDPMYVTENYTITAGGLGRARPFGGRGA